MRTFGTPERPADPEFLAVCRAAGLAQRVARYGVDAEQRRICEEAFGRLVRRALGPEFD